MGKKDKFNSVVLSEDASGILDQLREFTDNSQLFHGIDELMLNMAAYYYDEWEYYASEIDQNGLIVQNKANGIEHMSAEGKARDSALKNFKDLMRDMGMTVKERRSIMEFLDQSDRKSKVLELLSGKASTGS